MERQHNQVDFNIFFEKLTKPQIYDTRLIYVKNFEPNFHNLFRFHLHTEMDEDSKELVRNTLQELHEDLDKCIRFPHFQGDSDKKYIFHKLGLRRQTTRRDIGYLYRASRVEDAIQQLDKLVELKL